MAVIDEHVGELDVAMENVPRVQPVHRLNQLPDNLFDCVFREWERFLSLLSQVD